MEQMGWRSRTVTVGLLVLTALFGVLVNDYGAAGWSFAGLCALIAVAVLAV